MLSHTSSSKQAQNPPGTTPDAPSPTGAAPGTTLDACAMVPPLPPGTAAFDHALSAVIDHLMVIEDHQLAIEDRQIAIAWQQVATEEPQRPLVGHLIAIEGHLGTIATTFTTVKTLVEELLP